MKMMAHFAVLAAAVAIPFCATAEEFVTYEQFGAKGDGKHDDQSAIIAAHAAANEKGLPVKATDGKTYYIGKGKGVAVIKTDTDWGKAKFIIDDVETEDYRKPVFKVASFEESFDAGSIEAPKKGQKRIALKLKQKSLVVIEDKDKMVYIRKGLNKNNGHGMKEALVVDENGKVEKGCDIIWDYDNITSVRVYPVDDRLLTIRGGEFTTIANQAESRYKYQSRGIMVLRSNVLIENVTHLVKGEMETGAPYHAFIEILRSSDVKVRNCVFTAHKTYSTIGSAKKPVSMGSYDINVNTSCNVSFENCSQTTDINDTAYWGVFTSNYSKGLSLKNCVFSRFDAHQGVFNVTLRNCVFGHQGVRMVGFGLLLIEDCVVNASCFVQLRADYGSSWDGKMVFRNCVWNAVNPKGKKLELISGYNSGTHDFGYECCFPDEILIENLAINDDSMAKNKEYKGPELFSDYRRDPDAKDLIPFRIEGRTIIKNLSISSGKDLIISTNPKLFGKMEVVGK